MNMVLMGWLVSSDVSLGDVSACRVTTPAMRAAPSVPDTLQSGIPQSSNPLAADSE